MPDTRPVIDDVALVQFIAERGRETAFARVYPAGGLTVGLAGEAMSEIGLMAEAGAVLFTNGDWPVASAQVMKRVMTYAASRSAIVMSRPDDRPLAGGGVMNAGEFAARHGLPGIPIEAEWLGAARDVVLAAVTKGVEVAAIDGARSGLTAIRTTLAVCGILCLPGWEVTVPESPWTTPTCGTWGWWNCVNGKCTYKRGVYRSRTRTVAYENFNCTLTSTTVQVQLSVGLQ